MSARAALRLYRGFGLALYPFMGPVLRWRARRGKEDFARRAERYGVASAPRPDGPLVWLHAASVGESLAILPLIERMAGYGINIVLTTGTVTSAAVVRERLGGACAERVVHQFQPMDIRPAVRRFLDHWRPDLAIFAESEVWPVTVQELHRRRTHQLLVNARMSDRSNRRWRKRPGLARAIFGGLGHVVAQSEIDGQRFRNLGARRVSVTGNLKVDTGVPAADDDELMEILRMVGERPSWIAASVSPQEDAAMLDVAKRLLARRDDALAIIVPRHPDRAPAMRAMFEQAGLTVVSRTDGAPVTPDTQVFLGDTIGEMGLYYRLAPVTFMAKSLESANAAGGQNPIEPVLCGSAVLSGRNVQNFRDAYQQLVRVGGAKLVSDEAMLAAIIAHLWDNPGDLRTMNIAARDALRHMQGALERTLDVLELYLAPLRMRVTLDDSRTRLGAMGTPVSRARLNALSAASSSARSRGVGGHLMAGEGAGE